MRHRFLVSYATCLYPQCPSRFRLRTAPLEDGWLGAAGSPRTYTMNRCGAIVLGLVLVLGMSAEAARILVMFPLPGKSHFGAYAPFLEELAKRGHQVTVASAFPRKTPLANYTDIVLEDTLPPRDSSELNLFEIREQYMVPMFYFMANLCLTSCDKLLQQPNMQSLIHSNKQFDLVMIQQFFTECTYGIIHKFKAPVILLVPNTLISWNSDPMGNSNTVSYIPEMLTHRETLDFEGRMMNFIRWSYQKMFYRFYVTPRMEALMRKYFNDPTLPSIPDIHTRTALLFLHSHPIINFPRPLTPNTIEVGGLHLKQARNNLPQDLQKFMDDAPHGVIFFSLGSNVRSVDMPEAKRNSLLRAFSKLKQKVLWKWEADAMPGQPSNVRLEKWLPQHEILAHRNLKLFISHGGLMSIQEATYYGVPLVVIPVMADQKFNALHTQHLGYSVMVDIHNITEESVSWAIQETLQDPRYRTNARRIAQIFRDQPQTPMERAIFWTEYAIRHKGAPHLRSAALDLNFFEYYLLDVMALLAAGALVSLGLFLVTVRMLCRRCCSKRAASKSAPKSKKRN